MARAMTPALVVAAGVVLAGRGVASAGPNSQTAGRTSKVTIDTDPPGAKVYFGLKEDGEVCTTPCTVDAPIGETPIIIEAENRRSIIENMIVPRRTARPLKLSYKLEPAVGTLIVTGAAGAAIRIDEEDRGVAPARIEGVAAGGHRVTVIRNGAALYDEFLEVEVGGEVTVAPVETAAHPQTGPVVARAAIAARPARRGPMIAVSGAFDLGFRRFRYNRESAIERNSDELGQVMIGPIVELWPAAVLGASALPGLALYGRAELGVNAQQVTVADASDSKTSLATAWSSFELSLHQRWTIADTAAVEVGAGYTLDRYRFTGDPVQRAMVPEASYSAVRIGGRASLLFGSLEPYAAIENRIVVSGGALDERYKLGSSVNGYRAALGAALHLGRIELRAEASATRYRWTFKSDSLDPAQADAGSDAIEQISIALGYAY
jgi:hypothetical protein